MGESWCHLDDRCDSRRVDLNVNGTGKIQKGKITLKVRNASINQSLQKQFWNSLGKRSRFQIGDIKINKQVFEKNEDFTRDDIRKENEQNELVQEGGNTFETINREKWSQINTIWSLFWWRKCSPKYKRKIRSYMLKENLIGIKSESF
jgi:hypothetical protein